MLTRRNLLSLATLAAAAPVLAACSRKTPGGMAASDSGVWVMSSERQLSRGSEVPDQPELRNGITFTESITYELDERGNVVSEAHTTAFAEDSYGHKVVWSRDENGYPIERKTIFRSDNSEGDTAESTDESNIAQSTENYELTFDDQGRLTHQEVHTEVAKQPAATSSDSEDDDIDDDNVFIDYSYSDSGALIGLVQKEIVEQLPGNGETPVADFSKTKYNEQGVPIAFVRIQSSVDTMDDERAQSADLVDVNWRYDGDGRPTECTLALENDFIITRAYEYDESGNVKRMRETNDLYLPKVGAMTVETDTSYTWTYIENPSPAARLRALAFPGFVIPRL